MLSINLIADLLYVLDIKQPLTTTLQLEQGVIPLAASCLSPAIVDVSENMRAKLYALFCKMGELHLINDSRFYPIST